MARGFSQRYGLDYEETFASVVKFPIMRIILAMAALDDLEMLQMDVCTAYLHGIITEKIYMSQPDGYLEADKENKFCKLDKSIYGLKQSGKCWYQRLDKHLIKCGFRRSSADTNLYIRTRKEGTLYLLVYVDNLLPVSKDNRLLTVVRNLLAAEFEMKVLGEPSFLVGMQIKRNRTAGYLRIDQSKHISDVLRNSGQKKHMVQPRL